MAVKKRKNNSPIAVIGAGPAGLLAAITAAESGKHVVLYNKNPEPGKKISAIPPDEFFFSEKLPTRKLASSFSGRGDFVTPIFKAFGHAELTKFFKKLNINIEPDQAGRLRADGLTGRQLGLTLLDEALKRGVEYKKSSRVTDVLLNHGKISGVQVNSSPQPAAAVILAPGSISAPKHGATTDGYEISKRLGHRVVEPKPALLDFVINEKYGKILSGTTVEEINISIFFNGRQAKSEIGDIKFTPYGVSGPVILNHSAEIIEQLNSTPVEIRLDFMPDEPRELFETWLIKNFMSRRHLQVGQFLSRYFEDQTAKAIEAESRVKLDKSIAHITNLERKSLVHAIKDFRLTIKGPRPFNYTRGVLGGVATDEIDPATCESKIIKSLYFAGDVLDVLGPWGGYNMQFAFSSGFVAGNAVGTAAR